MLNFLKGAIIRKKNNLVSVRVGDIGYEIILSPLHGASLKAGDNVELIVHSHAREDSAELYGFRSFEELDFFRTLIGVSGVGPKTALNILSLGNIEEIGSAIARGDVQFLTRVSGIGKKSAERIIVELKDKIIEITGRGADAISGYDGILNDVMEALTSMGYKRSEAHEALKKIKTSGLSTEQILRAILRELA